MRFTVAPQHRSSAAKRQVQTGHSGQHLLSDRYHIWLMCKAQHAGVGLYFRASWRSGRVRSRSIAPPATRPGSRPWNWPEARVLPCRGPRVPYGLRLARSYLAPSYLTVTLAPAPSRAARALSALSLLTFSSTSLGAPSTRSLASFRPRLVRLRTSLMTWIFFSPAASRMTSNSSCSSACSASPPPAPAAAGAATAAGAAAFTSNVSSNCLTNSDSSRRVISLNASSRSALLIFAMVVDSSFLVPSVPERVVWSAFVGWFGQGWSVRG